MQHDIWERFVSLASKYIMSANNQGASSYAGIRSERKFDTYACKPCQENVKIAPIPPLLLPKSIATPELVAHTIVSKYVDHVDRVPLYRQTEIWKRLDIDLARNNLCGWVIKVAELCSPLIPLLQQNIVNVACTQADETPVQVLQEINRANTTKSYMWPTKVVIL